MDNTMKFDELEFMFNNYRCNYMEDIEEGKRR